MPAMDQAFLSGLSWSDLKIVAKENGVKANLKKQTMIEELLKVRKPKMLQLAKQQGDMKAMRIEKVRRRTVGGATTPSPVKTEEGPKKRESPTQTKPSAATRSSTKATSRSKAQARNNRTASTSQAQTVAKAKATAAMEAAKEVRPLDVAREKLRAWKAAEEKQKNELVVAQEDVAGPSGTSGTDVLAGVCAKLETIAVASAPFSQKTAQASRELEAQPAIQTIPTNNAPYNLRWKRPTRVLIPMGEPIPIPVCADDHKNNNDNRKMPLGWGGPVFSPPVLPGATLPDKSVPGDGSKAGSTLLQTNNVQVSVHHSSKEDDGDETDVAEEEEVYEMTSMDNILVGLEEDDISAPEEKQPSVNAKGKRKAESEESTLPLKRPRASLAWLFGGRT